MDLRSDALERQPLAAGNFLFFRVPQVEHNLFFHLVRYSQMSGGNHDSVALAGVLRASFLAGLLLAFCFFLLGPFFGVGRIQVLTAEKWH